MIKIKFIIYFIISIFLASCSENVNESDANSNAPTINMLSEYVFDGGFELTIYGNFFGNERKSGYVEFNGLKANENDYLIWNDSIISVKVPANATSGKLYVVSDSKRSKGVDYQIQIYPPEITLISKSGGTPGEDTLTIYGKYFGPERGSSYVLFTNILAHRSDYISWSDTRIKMYVPDNAIGDSVYVIVNNKRSNGWHFTIFEPLIKSAVINAGSFIMGSNKGSDWEKPEHIVTIDYDFTMSIYEITQEQWSLITGGNPSRTKIPENPVEQITWFQALKFCNQLSEGFGMQPCYTFYYDQNDPNKIVRVECNFHANGYRLPTEAEWEYACRAGTTGDFGGTGNIDDMGWTNNFNLDYPQKCGLKKPNAWGLFDMHGNVYEWCWDGFDSEFYSKSPKVNPSMEPLKSGVPEVVLRGGSYQDGSAQATSWKRNSFGPENYNYNWGFRIVRKK